MSNLKLGRWFYCKYCYKNIRPEIGDGVVVCPKCSAGLAPLEAVIKAGSLKAWHRGIIADFSKKHRIASSV